jgi:hypothetical protein
MTTWVNSQFPRPDFHRQVQRHYGLQDIVWSFLCSRWRISQLSVQVDLGAPGLDRLSLSRRARTFPLPEFYDMTVTLIPTAAVVALEESRIYVDFGGGDG